MVFKWLKNLFVHSPKDQAEQVTEQAAKKVAMPEASNKPLVDLASEETATLHVHSDKSLETIQIIEDFDPQQALRRVTKDQAQELSQSQTIEPEEKKTSELKEASTYLNGELIVINNGEQKSLCLTKDLSSSHFGQASLVEQNMKTPFSSLDELSAYLSNKAIPLYRDQVIRMISPFKLRLPQVSELQALYAANELASDTVYWTRDSRDRLYSPSEGRFRSVKQNLKVKLALFFANEALDWDQLADKPYLELDAQASLATLASEAMDKLNFGLFEEAPVSHSELISSNILLSNASAFQLEAKSEDVAVQVAQPQTLGEECPNSIDLSECSALQKALFAELPTEYISHILHLDKDELITKILTIIKNEQKISSKDLASKYGISMIVASLNLSKFDRALKQNQLEPLVANKFETTRTAPVTGTYFTWLLN